MYVKYSLLDIHAHTFLIDIIIIICTISVWLLLHMHLFIDSEVCTYSGVMQFNAMHSMMIIVHTCTLESYIQIAKNLGLFIMLQHRYLPITKYTGVVVH